jgi:hypothetical protein
MFTGLSSVLVFLIFSAKKNVRAEMQLYFFGAQQVAINPRRSRIIFLGEMSES